MTDLLDQNGPDTVNLIDALEERYLEYALSTISHRALPDVRDGLKPVHRRLLFAMRLLKLDPGQGYKKSARIVGDVIGKFHPHGDQSVYDALVRLAQDFAVRYPLVDGQGNFGNIDGDSAAAMRYTETRLTDVARRMLDGLDKNAVDFRPTYSGEDEEPVVLPANFPYLLANGSAGIAVGMATSVPPHNVAELCEAAVMLIDNPKVETAQLCHKVQGPDFPTGGVIVEDKHTIIKAYETGRGGFRTRAVWDQEDAGRGGYVIVVTQIPYQVQKSKLVEKIADLLLAKKVHLLKDVRDESAEDVRLVLEPKSRMVDPVLLMESLFKLTDLETRFSMNMNVLDGGKVPRVMGLKQALGAWLTHRKDVLVRTAQHRLEAIEKRLEILQGYLIAYLNIDEVIRIIRFEDHPKQQLMATFNLTDHQSEAILNMRLRALRKLEEMEIKTEHEVLTKEADGLRVLLASDKKQWSVIRKQVLDLGKAYGQDTGLGARRSKFGKVPDADFDSVEQAMIDKEPITIILSEMGWVRALKGHSSDLSNLTYKAGDALKIALKAQTTDKILALSTSGKIYTLGADKLPGGRGYGEPLRLMIDMEEGHDIVSLFVYDPKGKRLIASTAANGFVVEEKDMIANTKKGKQVLNVKEPDEAFLCMRAVGDHVAVIGENRKLLVFPLEQLPQMGRGKGVRLQKYKDGGLSDISVFSLEQGLSWTDSAGRSWIKKADELAEWLGARAQAGRMPPHGFPKNNKFTG